MLDVTVGNTDKYAKLQDIEADLLKKNLERDSHKAELNKIPESAKTMVQIKRRQFLEEQVKVLSKDIAQLKIRIKQFQ